MDKIKLLDLDAKVVDEIEINKNLIVSKPHNQSIFDSVIAENAGKRQGTHSTLTKGEVRGGGKKPYAQKHTGNARQGSIRNPHFVGGGVAFGPKPTRNYKVGVNAKNASLAFKSAFTLKANKDTMFCLVDEIKMKKPSTKQIIKLLKAIDVNGKKVLFIVNDDADALMKSVRNIQKSEIKK
jgi:large subunit ribosomal protein L4